MSSELKMDSNIQSKEEEKEAEPKEKAAGESGGETEDKPEDKTEIKAEDKPENKTEDKAEDKSEIKTADKTEDKTEDKPERPRKKRKWKILAVGITVLLMSVLLAYFGVAYYFRDHFLPNTIIDGEDVGGKTSEEVIAQLNGKISRAFKVDVQGRDSNVLISLKAEDVDLEISVQTAVEEILKGQNSFLWVNSLWSSAPVVYEAEYTMEYSPEKMQEALENTGMFSKENIIEPTDAYIGGYVSGAAEYELVEENEGSLLNEKATLDCVLSAIDHREGVVDLVEEECYELPAVRADDENLQMLLTEMNRMVATKVIYDWNGREEILDGEQIHEWISLQDGEVILDEEQVRGYVEEKAQEYDTYGKKRKFTTTLGVELTLRSGAYGWKTDCDAETEALIQLIREGAVTDREPEYIHTGYVKGSNDIGDSYVEIDLTNQHLYLYIKGSIILETDFVSGNVSRGNTTPAGVFGITYKTTNAVLRGRDYETPVSYWMPFNGNIGMHDASWRREFGGDIYLTNGSHGCVNLPKKMAKKIYDYMEKKFPVVCYYY